ncbi:acyl-[acyl-carrier-protein] thioesterase [Clostridium sardiniense]|uniref:Acyl-[acyl-carrier-protein] thioesterase n=1 Tax=Clostridium sardiniense TaxID=29369 RepID=A0ABS7L025_CLOSR|nr:acyl-ACP thioesterase domain-containing protein [Clostridium sardiniense]MBY0756413.1 acyl-[acyl-carrier-protein] thioesterase [Clostridium sardiniense]MDQ0459260.1 acyl-ACP thioesterase [Clostridium sardiniense]
MNNVFEKEYRINIFDVDSEHKCKFSSLVDYLWDVVISQSDYLGETNEGFVHNQCIWVLLKYDITIYEYPKFRDKITVDTKALGTKKFYGYRHNNIKDSEGKIIGEVVSTAILIDFEKRRPMKIAPDQREIYGLEGELEEVPPLDDIPNIQKEDYIKDYPIRYSDIDSNGHVNNVKYMEMAMDTLPRSILNEYELFNIKVLFKKETTDGDTLHISSEVINDENNEITTIHNITSDNTGKLLTKLQFIWKKN